MIHFRWTWTGLLITEDHKSLQSLSDIKAEMDRKDACVENLKMTSNPLVSYVSNMQQQCILTKEPTSVTYYLLWQWWSKWSQYWYPTIFSDLDSLGDNLPIVCWHAWEKFHPWLHGTFIFFKTPGDIQFEKFCPNI